MDNSYTIPAAAIIASTLSLIVDYFPVVRTWFGSLAPERQRDASFIVALIIGFVMFLQANTAFVANSWLDYLFVFVSLCANVLGAISGSQGTKYVADKTLGAVGAGKLTTEVTVKDGNTTTTVSGPSSSLPEATTNVSDATGITPVSDSKG